MNYSQVVVKEVKAGIGWREPEQAILAVQSYAAAMGAEAWAARRYPGQGKGDFSNFCNAPGCCLLHFYFLSCEEVFGLHYTLTQQPYQVAVRV